MKDAEAAKPAIDITALSNVVGNADSAFSREVLALFRTTEADKATKLAELARTRDGAALALAAHAVKGATASAFAIRLAELCR